MRHARWVRGPRARALSRAGAGGETSRPRLIAVVGPTAAGKTALGVAVAKAVGGEVVNCDSRLFYSGLDIGTAKPTAAERGGVRHHLIDFLDPREAFSLAEYLDRAGRIVGEIGARGAVPVLVGGTGQYAWGLIEGWQVPRVPPNAALRARLEAEAVRSGPQALHARLRAVDPEAAARIDPRNVRRVVRALEVAAAGEPAPPGGRRTTEARFEALILGLTMPRRELYERADRRIDRMIARGWVEEVRGLLAAGVPRDAPCMSAIGYGELAANVAGEVSLEEATALAKRATRRLIRHQCNWFRLTDGRIRWLEVGPGAGERAAGIARGWAASGERVPK